MLSGTTHKCLPKVVHALVRLVGMGLYSQDLWNFSPCSALAFSTQSLDLPLLLIISSVNFMDFLELFLSPVALHILIVWMMMNRITGSMKESRKSTAICSSIAQIRLFSVVSASLGL